MATYPDAFVFTIMKNEGGNKLTGKDYDGQVTKFGITQHLLNLIKINKKVENIDKNWAFNFYQKYFWLKIKLDKIYSQTIANSIFDFAVNQGNYKSILLLQKSINEYQRKTNSGIIILVEDGIMGRNTIQATNSIFRTELFMSIFRKHKLKEYNKDNLNRFKRYFEDFKKKEIDFEELKNNVIKWQNINEGWINRTFARD